MNRNKKLLLGVLGGTVALYIYILGLLMYSYHFLPQTFINGADIGGKTLEQVEVEFLGEAPHELIFLGMSGEKEGVTLESIGYKTLTSAEDLSAIKDKQNYYGWPFFLFNKKINTIELGASYNKEALKYEIESLKLVTNNEAVEPIDAVIVPLKGGYGIQPEVQGTKVDPDKLFALSQEYLLMRNFELDLSKEGAYKSPSLTKESPELLAGVEKLNGLVNVKIKYDLGGGHGKGVVDYETFGDWLHVDSKGAIEADKVKVAQFVTKLGAESDTVGKERDFKTSEGNKIRIGGGIYGWKIDVANTTNQLAEILEAGGSKNLEPLYLQKGKTRKGNEIGDTYIEISLTSQHLWQYIDGELVLETPIVSGLPTPERETPTGVFYIWSLERKRYLEGEDYKLWVEYWLPFNFSGIGIHDSTWQPAYGPAQLWVTGSHGCINTPPDILPEIYNRVEIGTPVIVYK